ncbi:LON peptidase substrate-binding domain-containing protein [Shigella flexneri]|uniref:LON peptidase substrate-binding domain-containing protein n=1 Tax=Shigella flexneri TaxID=623 RepID=UPI000DA452B8|nr:LON peptidase substrate-binding domain-containing protein [Shigella flexneri]SRJ41537.1 multidrug transporter membrane\ATP-binding components [Shigella flexneri]
MNPERSERIEIPVLPLRDVVVYPHMVIPLFVGREKSIRCLEAAMDHDKKIMLVAQKEASTDEPGVNDLFTVGTVASILQMLKLPDGTVKVLVEGLQRARIDARFDPTIYIAIGMANLLAIGGGSWMVVQGSLTLGQLTSFMMYLGLMIWPMLALAWMFNIVERGSAAYSRIRAMLAEAPVVNDGSEPVPEGRGELDVNIHQFTYPQTDHPALENVNFALKPGQMLGICGPTGSGKSTLLSLIQRHFDVSEGDIRFHDIPLTKLQLDSWRSRLAVVSQTPFLFSDTVANNIALGCPNATQQEIEHVARLASVHDDILRLPQGYDTEVGERGVMLSGGQKQRISIARALLVNAEILILDDALSAVDGRTEHQILHNLRQWGQGRTVIISAHRLSALTEASEIIVMQHGHIAQRGNHDELAQQSGWYRDMYRYQQLEAALDDVPEIREEAVDA